MPSPTAPRYDVPLGIAAGALAVLLAVFLPLVRGGPVWPTELAHLAYDPAAVLADHRRDLARRPPAATREALRAWDAWSRAAAAGDPARSEEARQRFADVLAEATERVRDAELALRARATERFLARLDDPRDPLATVARRHRLAGDAAPWYATRAARVAWFALRWERNAAPVGDDGQVEPFGDTLRRVPDSYRRAFVSWSLDARCPELVGAAARPLTAADLRGCAALREQLVDAARAVDPAYPREESLAAADVFLGLGLRRLASGHDAPVVVVDDAGRASALADAQAALVRAQGRYAHLLETTPSRRVEQHLMAVVAELGDDASP